MNRADMKERIREAIEEYSEDSLDPLPEADIMGLVDEIYARITEMEDGEDDVLYPRAEDEDDEAF